MAVEVRSTLKRFILWDYHRAVWQYDVMVGLILAFIFLTPRDWFRDQPRASSVVPLSAEQYWIEPALLAGTPDGELSQRAAGLLKSRTGKIPPHVRVEPIFNAEQEIQGYMVYTRR
jgi:hypothetical protein